jgi:Zn-dependent protease
MFNTLNIGKMFGIPVKIHWTFWLLGLVITFDAWQENQSMYVVGFSLALIILVFGCVVLHEFGHALTARRFGVGTQDILLTPIGGIARMMGNLRTPTAELLVAIAGPMVNVIIALLLYLILEFGNISSDISDSEISSLGSFSVLLLKYLFYINKMLVLFNMIPAFPMDGGRVLRALLGYAFNLKTATNIARWISLVCCAGFVLYGLYFGQYTLAIIGLFIFSAAQQEYRSLENEEKITKTSLINLADYRVQKIEKNQPMYLLLNQNLEQPYIVENEGIFWGILSPKKLKEAKIANDIYGTVEDYAQNLTIEMCVEADKTIADIPVDILQFFSEKTDGIIPIKDINDRVNGIIVTEIQPQFG